MRKLLLLLPLLLLVLIPTAHAQSNPQTGHGAPIGVCLGPYMDIDTGNFYTCKVGQYIQTGGANPVTSNPTICTTGQTFFNTTTSQFLLCVAPNTLTTAAGSPATGIDATLFGVVPDGHWVSDASTTNTSNIVTCPNSDCNFTTTAKAGQVIFGTAGLGIVLPQTTIQSVDSATQIHTVGNATVTGTANVILTWGSDNTTAMQNAYNALFTSGQCAPNPIPRLMLPSGLILIQSGIGPTANLPASCNPGVMNADATGLTVVGQGIHSTNIVFTPNFNYNSAVCAATGCLFGGEITAMRDFRVWGGELTFTAPANPIIKLFQNMYIDNIKVEGIGPVNWGAVTMASCANCHISNLYMNNSGFLSIGGGCANCAIYNTFNNVGIRVNGDVNTTLNDFNGQYAQGQPTDGQMILVAGGAKYNCYGCQSQPGGSTTVGLRIRDASIANLYNAQIGQNLGAQFGIFWDATGGTVNASNGTLIKGGSSGALSNSSNNTGAVFIDRDGTTTFTGSLDNFLPKTNSTFIADGHGLKAVCTGVATASSTLTLVSSGVSLAGGALTSACTGATLDKGVAVQGARVLRNLICTSSATTVSVACTVMTSHNGGAFASSGVTCTMTAATACDDSTHTLTLADGDLVTIQIVTGAAETGANIKAYVEWNLI